MDAVLRLSALPGAPGSESDRLNAVAALASAMRGSAALALASTAQRAAFPKAIGAARPHLVASPPPQLLAPSTSYPVAVGATAAVTAIAETPALQAYLTAFCGSLVSAALRLAPIGQSDGIAAVALLDPTVTRQVEHLRAAPFETIGAAVEEGRVIYDNIRKFVFYLFSCNVAEIVVLLAASLAALPLPLMPLQILWLNIITDTFPALALAVEPGDPDVMTHPPRRPEEAILSRAFLLRIVYYGALITAATLMAFVWALANVPERATTMAFMTLALAQLFHLGNARSEHAVLTMKSALANRYAIGALVLSIALQVMTAHVDPCPRPRSAGAP